MAPFLCFSGIAPTIGDTAIGQAILQQLKRRLDLPIRVRTNRADIFGALPELGEPDRVGAKLPAVPAPPMHAPQFPFRLYALLRDLRQTGGARLLPPERYAALRDTLHGCAAVIFQGGPAWTDRMMDRRQALDRWLFLEAARHYGARTYHVGVSCGRFAWPYPERLWMAPLCRNALNRYDLLFVRDTFSRPSLDRLGVSARVVESTDAAVFLESRRDPDFGRVEERIHASPRPRVVVCVRDYQPAYPRALAARDTVLQSLARVLEHVQREQADVFFLSTDHNPRPEKQTDVEVARRVQQMMTVPGSFILDEDVRNPAGLKHIYGQFDAMISMRLHPTILALDHGVPCLLLSYDDKCRDFFASLDMQAYAVPLAEFQPARAIAQLTEMLGSTELRGGIRARYGALKAAHADDYEPMFLEISARAHDLHPAGGRPPSRQEPGDPDARQGRLEERHRRITGRLQ